LRAQGLVFAERGRQGLSWELTPRGLLVVNRLLGAHENPDHPVDSMVIASKQVASGDVAAALSATKPREVTVLRHGDVVTYQRRIHDEAHQIDVAAKSGPKERNGTPPVAIETVVDDLLGRIHASAPSVFSIDDETVYEQVHRRVAAGAVLASR
jgi:hypothetical protein